LRASRINSQTLFSKAPTKARAITYSKNYGGSGFAGKAHSRSFGGAEHSRNALLAASFVITIVHKSALAAALRAAYDAGGCTGYVTDNQATHS
jgi:hypothetical protein